jgi:Zn-dependent protease with chaperone function
MQCAVLPVFLVHDIPTPGAWTQSRHIVLSKRSLDLERSQLSAMIAHELHHYAARDGVRATFIWASALPVAMLTEAQGVMNAKGGRFFGVIGASFFWPAMVLLRFAIAPANGVANRQCEYEA